METPEIFFFLIFYKLMDFQNCSPKLLSVMMLNMSWLKTKKMRLAWPDSFRYLILLIFSFFSTNLFTAMIARLHLDLIISWKFKIQDGKQRFSHLSAQSYSESGRRKKSKTYWSNLTKLLLTQFKYSKQWVRKSGRIHDNNQASVTLQKPSSEPEADGQQSQLLSKAVKLAQEARFAECIPILVLFVEKDSTSSEVR